jgi:hypothetical protein
MKEEGGKEEQGREKAREYSMVFIDVHPFTLLNFKKI